MNKSNYYDGNSYIIVYYDALNNLGITITDYLVLKRIRFKSKRNEYKDGVTQIAQYLNKSRGTIYKSLHNLFAKGFLYHEDGSYHLHYLTDETLQEYDKGKFTIFYSSHAKELELSAIQYCLLYCYYSLAKKRGIAYAHIHYYMRCLKIEERNYYRIRDRLIEQSLIYNLGKNEIKISDHIIDWFNSRVQK